jgi:hypothetical protein
MKVFLQGLDTFASCYLFSLCLSVLLIVAALITLVVLGMLLLRASKLFNKKEIDQTFDDTK